MHSTIILLITIFFAAHVVNHINSIQMVLCQNDLEVYNRALDLTPNEVQLVLLINNDNQNPIANPDLLDSSRKFYNKFFINILLIVMADTCVKSAEYFNSVLPNDTVYPSLFALRYLRVAPMKCSVITENTVFDLLEVAVSWKSKSTDRTIVDHIEREVMARKGSSRSEFNEMAIRWEPYQTLVETASPRYNVMETLEWQPEHSQNFGQTRGHLSNPSGYPLQNLMNSQPAGNITRQPAATQAWRQTNTTQNYGQARERSSSPSEYPLQTRMYNQPTGNIMTQPAATRSWPQMNTQTFGQNSQQLPYQPTNLSQPIVSAYSTGTTIPPAAPQTLSEMQLLYQSFRHNARTRVMQNPQSSMEQRQPNYAISSRFTPSQSNYFQDSFDSNSYSKRRRLD